MCRTPQKAESIKWSTQSGADIPDVVRLRVERPVSVLLQIPNRQTAVRFCVLIIQSRFPKSKAFGL